jgi:hypothetical protein
MRGDLLYRCRLCGGVFTGRTVPNVMLALDVIRGELPTPAPAEWGHAEPATLETARHDCPSGEIGIGDLAGGRATPTEIDG